MNAFFSSTLCPRCSGQPEFEVKPAGTVNLDLNGLGTWTSDIVFPAPLFGVWDIEDEPVILFSDTQQPPR